MTDVLPLVRGELSSRTPGGRSVIWAATGRLGGVSAGAFASANLAEHVGDDPTCVQVNRDSVLRLTHADHLAVVHAEHGARVRRVSSVAERDHEAGVASKVPCDGLVTTDSGVALLALGADCATIAITDGTVLAVGHCGWAGLAVDLPGELIRQARAMSTSGETRAWSAIVGPTICAACYSVPMARRAELRERVSEYVAQAALAQSPAGIDVRAGVHAALIASATAVNDTIEIVDVDRCTYETPELYSYRRDSLTGRHGLVAAFAPGSASTQNQAIRAED